MVNSPGRLVVLLFKNMCFESQKYLENQQSSSLSVNLRQKTALASGLCCREKMLYFAREDGSY